MSEKEKKIVEKLKEAIPKMSEFDKGYFLGVGETIAKYKNNGKEEKVEKKTEKGEIIRRI